MDRLIQAQRARHVGPRGRGRRRRRRAAARQDRHHHARQPPGRRSSSRRRASTDRATSPTPRSSPPSPTRRPRAAASSCWPRRSTACASATSHDLDAHVRPLHRADAHERRRRRTAACDPQGRGRRHRARTSDRKGGEFPESVRAHVDEIAKHGRHAARRRRRQRVLGVIHLKDIVKGGMKSASPSCARWASRR